MPEAHVPLDSIALEVLSEAATLIENSRGLLKGSYQTHPEAGSMCFCLTGAIRWAARKKVQPLDGLYGRVVDRATEMLADETRPIRAPETAFSVVVNYNDRVLMKGQLPGAIDPGAKAPAVVLIRQAIERFSAPATPAEEG